MIMFIKLIIILNVCLMTHGHTYDDNIGGSDCCKYSEPNAVFVLGYTDEAGEVEVYNTVSDITDVIKVIRRDTTIGRYPAIEYILTLKNPSFGLCESLNFHISTFSNFPYVATLGDFSCAGCVYPSWPCPETRLLDMTVPPSISTKTVVTTTPTAVPSTTTSLCINENFTQNEANDDKSDDTNTSVAYFRSWVAMNKSRRELQASSKPVRCGGQQRRMVRVQRSEPQDGIVRNELRFVYYQPKPGRLNAVQPESQVMADAFAALLECMDELGVNNDASAKKFSVTSNSVTNNGNINLLEQENNSLKQKVASANEVIERLRRQLEDARDQANVVVNTLST